MRKTFLTFLVDLFLTNIIEYIIELTSEIIKRLLKKLSLNELLNSTSMLNLVFLSS